MKEIFEQKIDALDKEIYKIKENEWKKDFLIKIKNDIKNIDAYMLGLANTIKIVNYTKIENLYAQIYVNSKKPKSIFNYELAYQNIRNIINEEIIEVEKEEDRLNELIETQSKLKEVLLDIKLNSETSITNMHFIINILNDIPNEHKVRILSQLNYYGKDHKTQIDTLLEIPNLEKVPRYEIDSPKRKTIYSYAPDMFKILEKNNWQDIENLLYEVFDNYNFDNKEKALFTSLLLEKIYIEIENYRNIFLNENFYKDVESSNEISKLVENLKNAYNKILSLYKGFTIIEELEDKRDLNFAYVCNRPKKARAIEDIENYLSSNSIDPVQTRYTLNLLQGYLNKDPKVVFETITGIDGYYKIKLRSGKGTGTGRLKKPRIVLKKENNKMIIIGFFLKHDQTGNRDYNQMANRTFILNENMDQISTEYILNLLENKISKTKIE